MKNPQHSKSNERTNLVSNQGRDACARKYKPTNLRGYDARVAGANHQPRASGGHVENRLPRCSAAGCI
jgi:hypothetical protein